MLRKSRERFKELCEHAEVVEDKNKLSKIAEEIDRILDDELERLKNVPLSKPAHTEASCHGYDPRLRMDQLYANVQNR
jgi:hypothetical protein